MWEKMETKTIVYDLDTSGGLMEVRVPPFPSAPGILHPTKPLRSLRREDGGGGCFLTPTPPPSCSPSLPSLQFGGTALKLHRTCAAV